MPLVEEIADVFTGVSFRGKIKGDPNGSVGVVQLRDLGEDYTSIGEVNLHIDTDQIKQRYILKKGDLLFIAKGNVNACALYNGYPEQAVATSVFFVIRITSPLVLPTYLQWYLNLPKTQILFKINQTGTYTPSVKKEVLEGTEINLPNLEVQEKVSRLYYLERKEGRLLTEIREKRNMYIDNILLQTINE